MSYSITRDEGYDFLGQSYSSAYPNLHRYPATMLPQIGIKLLKDFDIPRSAVLLDPYCGTGSSFSSALEHGISQMYGFDLNPLAVLISRAKFQKIEISALRHAQKEVREKIYDFLKNNGEFSSLTFPEITNSEYWFSKSVLNHLALIKWAIGTFLDRSVQNFFLVPFSETVRSCSYTRSNEFKLFRMKPELVLEFNPDVLSVFFKKLEDVIEIYSLVYYPKLGDSLRVHVENSAFQEKASGYDVVLTSPPYGDSRTTVAYGQFSTLANEWMGFPSARKVDRFLMGGEKSKGLYSEGLIKSPIEEIAKTDLNRALEVSSFYKDLASSIDCVAKSVRSRGKAFYVVGNRTVKGVELPTDQFVAESFERNGFSHLSTIKRALSSKAMPSRNSPTNVPGKTANTMLWEYIVVCEKK